MQKFFTLSALGFAILALAFGLAPLGSRAADHLDAPGLTSPGADGRLDITDIYAFQSPANPDHTVLIMNVNPAAGALSPTSFHPHALYEFRLDLNGDAKSDWTYQFDFSAHTGSTVQRMVVRTIPPSGGMSTVASGSVGQNLPVKGGGQVRAGLFDDPFFFDLNAFLGAYPFCEAPGGPAGSSGSDFFAGLNVSAIVLEVPSSTFGSDNIGVWARTLFEGAQVDRMGRPAINTVFIPSDFKNAFNEGKPKTDAQEFSQFFGPFAGVLLPDILTVDVSSSAGFLNGRQLADDVIDIELTVLGISPGSDCVDANDLAFLSAFPYLAPPH